MLERSYIMIHHSLTKDSQTVSWPAIENFHITVNGWRDIGYHAGIEQVTDNQALVGYAYQALLGRGATEQAAACPQASMNTIALHVCCVGNFDLAPPPDEMLKRLAQRIVRPWMEEYGIPVEKIIGHHDANPSKSCPGIHFDLAKLRSMVA